MSKSEKKVDALGRTRRAEQDEALERINRERRHSSGITPMNHRIAAPQWVHDALGELSTTERGKLIEEALKARPN